MHRTKGLIQHNLTEYYQGAVTCVDQRCGFAKVLDWFPPTFQPIARSHNFLHLLIGSNASKRALAWLKLIETKIHQKVEEGWNFAAPIWENKDKLILLWSDASPNWIMWLIGWFIGGGGTYIEHEDVLQIRNESRLMALDLPLMVFLCAFSDSALTKKKKRIFLL